MTYTYKTINTLVNGQYFQFKSGGCINQVLLKERNLLIFTNVVTRKTRRVKGFVDSHRELKICKLRYCIILDSMFENYYQNRIDILHSPF